eukprot:PhF_6_TR37090/c1_g1_i2/m.54398
MTLSREVARQRLVRFFRNVVAQNVAKHKRRTYFQKRKLFAQQASASERTIALHVLRGFVRLCLYKIRILRSVRRLHAQNATKSTTQAKTHAVHALQKFAKKCIKANPKKSARLKLLWCVSVNQRQFRRVLVHSVLACLCARQSSKMVQERAMLHRSMRMLQRIGRGYLSRTVTMSGVKHRFTIELNYTRDMDAASLATAVPSPSTSCKPKPTHRPNTAGTMRSLRGLHVGDSTSNSPSRNHHGGAKGSSGLIDHRRCVHGDGGLSQSVVLSSTEVSYWNMKKLAREIEDVLTGGRSASDATFINARMREATKIAREVRANKKNPANSTSNASTSKLSTSVTSTPSQRLR